MTEAEVPVVRNVVLRTRTSSMNWTFLLRWCWCCCCCFFLIILITFLLFEIGSWSSSFSWTRTFSVEFTTLTQTRRASVGEKMCLGTCTKRWIRPSCRKNALKLSTWSEMEGMVTMGSATNNRLQVLREKNGIEEEQDFVDVKEEEEEVFWKAGWSRKQ